MDLRYMNFEPFYQWTQSVGLTTKQHQIDGFTWCMNQELNGNQLMGGFKGGILADEMGLGKTILMLGALVCNEKDKTLIVLPPALLHQWVQAIRKFCPVLFNAIHVWHGATGTNDIAYDKCISKQIKVVLTTYGMIANRRIENYTSDLWIIEWDRIIYDEAHHLRNSSTNVFGGAHKMHAMQETEPIIWFVSGTPINNNLNDIRSLLILANVSPHIYCLPDKIEELLENRMLRRTKKSVGINLKDYNENIIEVEFSSPEEKKFARDLHNGLGLVEINDDNVDECMAFLSEHWLGLLMRARQMCILPQLVSNVITSKVYDEGLYDDIDLSLLKKMQTHSKITAVVDKIKENAYNGKNKIVFCHYRAEIDKLDTLLSKTLNVLKLDGRTSKKERKEILSKSDANVLLIQIQTGCEGLNLQQYSEVYFTSPHWNPAVEDQAIARAHRIGQKKDVDVYRFICKFNNKGSTIDQYCKRVQDVKRELQEKYIKVSTID